MAEFASKGVAGAGLGLGIAGTALGILNNGGIGNLLSGCNNIGCCSENMPVSRYELGQEQKISELQSQIALRDANTYNDQKIIELYKYIDGELKQIRATACENEKAQAVINAQFESGFNVLNSQVKSVVATVANITKTAVPTSAICDFGCGCNNCCGGNI